MKSTMSKTVNCGAGKLLERTNEDNQKDGGEMIMARTL